MVVMDPITVQIIEVVAALVGIAATIGSVIIGIRKLTKNRFKTATYYISRGIFSDRVNALRELTKIIRSGTRLINVYGKRGIGKSAFLRFFCDFVNHKLTRENRKVHRGLSNIRGNALYIHLTGEGTNSIDDQIVSQIVGFGTSLSEIAKNLSQSIKKKRILIVIDNVNNAGLCKDIEAIVDTFFAYSERFVILVGSIEKQPFLNISNSDQLGYIELPAFDGNDIFEFAKKNAPGIPRSYIAKVIDFSDGLPVFVSLLLSNDVDSVNTSLLGSERMDRYLERIIDDLDIGSRKLALYIGFLTITNAVVPLQLVHHVKGHVHDETYTTLENSALIEFDRARQEVKMHELFKNYICRHYRSDSEIILAIYDYYSRQDKIYEQVYYLIMLENEISDVIIATAINRAIQEENYSFLIMLGEHYKNLYDLDRENPYLSEETFLVIIYGYLEGLIGIGDYPAAREVIDRCKIAVREPVSDIQFRFSLSIAQLYHLQNDYEEAIEYYSILLGYARSISMFNKYEAKCLWGMAHSLRHEGLDFDSASQYYQDSIAAACRLDRKSEIIKSMKEKMIIHLCRGEFVEATDLHNQIKDLVDQLPKDGYIATKASLDVAETIYLHIVEHEDENAQLALLINVYERYKQQRKRLQYNVCFQFGEYYRHLGDVDRASEYYNKSLKFSKKNRDHNLETLSQIALAICHFLTETKHPSDMEGALIRCVDTCKQYNLHMNMLLAEILLAYAQNRVIDSAIKQELARINYRSAITLSNDLSMVSMSQLILFLM